MASYCKADVLTCPCSGVKALLAALGSASVTGAPLIVTLTAGGAQLTSAGASISV